jgi:hypothetical protein
VTTFSWWAVTVAVAIIAATIWEGWWFPRQARRLREILKGGTGSHAETFATQRSKYRRMMRSWFATGVLPIAIGSYWAFTAQWNLALICIVSGVGSLATTAIGFVCWRMLGPPRESADT